jgi:hypothetical protein
MKSEKHLLGKTLIFAIKKDRNFFRPLIQIMKNLSLNFIFYPNYNCLPSSLQSP